MITPESQALAAQAAAEAAAQAAAAQAAATAQAKLPPPGLISRHPYVTAGALFVAGVAVGAIAGHYLWTE